MRTARPLSEATLCIAPTPSFPAEVRDGVNRLIESVGRVEAHCDCYAYGRLAQGDFDLVIEADLAPYDFCALAPVVKGAGGVIHHWNGEPVGLDTNPTLVAASDAALAGAALELLQG